jgi:glycosyltransferase involved in cell wall biosynthesis
MARIVRGGRDAEVMIFEVDECPLAVPWLLQRLFMRRFRPILAVRDFTPLDEFHGMQKFYRSLLRYISLLLSRFFDAVFVISPMLGQETRTKHGISPDKIHVWPSSVDTDFFDPSKYGDDRDRIRKELGLADRFLLIHHGHLSEERGLYELLEATRIAHEEDRNIALLLLGKGPAKDGAKELVRSSKLDNVVIFHDPVPSEDVPRFIAAADAGVHPLPNQPQWLVQTPTKVLEYLSMRKPVIVTDIPANRWIVGNRPVAFFCGDGRPQEIAEAILRCVRARSSVPEAERCEIAARFSPDSLAQRLVEILGGTCTRS